MPIMAMISSLISRAASTAYLAYLGGRPLPSLTGFWTLGITQSGAFVPSCFILGSLFWFVALKANSIHNEAKVTALLSITTLGYSLSLLIIGTTCIAAALPFMMPVTTLTK